MGGSGPRTHHGKNEAGRGTGAALGSHGRVEHAVDRGEVRDGQTLSNRQDFPATAVQGHSRRRDPASALCGGEGAGSVARRKKARTGTSNGTGTRTSRLVGGHEVRSEGSAREKVLETSIFWRRRGGPEIGEMENGDGESSDPAASADVARQARVECFSSEEASPAEPMETAQSLGDTLAVVTRAREHGLPRGAVLCVVGLAAWPIDRCSKKDAGRSECATRSLVNHQAQRHRQTDRPRDKRERQ